MDSYLKFYILNLKYLIQGFILVYSCPTMKLFCSLDFRLKIVKKAAGLLYLGLSTPACLFWVSGHGCGNGGIYHPPGSAPNGLPTWVKLGSYWVGGAGCLVRANRGQSTNIFSFAPARSVVDNHTDDKTHDSHHWQLR